MGIEFAERQREAVRQAVQATEVQNLHLMTHGKTDAEVPTLLFFTPRLLELLARSFTTLPVGPVGLVFSDFRAVAGFITDMFALGLLVALPAVQALRCTCSPCGVV